MPLPHALVADLTDAGLAPIVDAPLSRRTYWRVGGNADGLLGIDRADDLVRVLALADERGVDVLPLGNGSNLLVADAGVRGLVITLGGDLADARRDGDVLTVGAGLKLAVLLNRAASQGWPGLEALAGIPGTVGGAVRMNAGTSLGEVGDQVIDVEVATPDGLVVLRRDLVGFAYRHTALPPGSIVTQARLRLRGDPAASTARMREFLDRRKATQPLDLPSCGSTFTNPPGDHAGRLIDAAGLKGFTVGGAQVSPKHANFIVNLGDASASDIRDVIEHVQRTVLDAFGIALVPEVQLVGDWSTYRPGGVGASSEPARPMKSG